MDLDRYISWAIIYAKGLAMGCAGAVPGVSGGTIALISGIYGRLITAVTSVNLQNIKTVLNGLNPSNLSEAREAFTDMDIHFLLILGAGILTAVVTVSKAVHYLLSVHPVPTFGFFFGLIAVSATVLYRKVDLSTSGRKTAALTGFVVAFSVSGYATNAVGHSLPVVFVAGMVSISAMVLPGISGSLILLILGQYEYMTGALSRFVDASVSGIVTRDVVPIFEAAPPVAVFVSGAVAGIFTVSHLVRWALNNYRHATVAFLVSLVAGALRAPVVEVERALVSQGSTWAEASPLFLSAALLGGGLIFVFDRYTGLIEY